eukprot:COSAG04_NODE_1613_length_6165_cov_3.524069_7_plen_98_part_00
MTVCPPPEVSNRLASADKSRLEATVNQASDGLQGATALLSASPPKDPTVSMEGSFHVSLLGAPPGSTVCVQFLDNCEALPLSVCLAANRSSVPRNDL